MFQIIPIQSVSEGKFAGYFIILLIIFEVLLYFISQRIKNSEKSSLLLNIFMIYFIGLLLLQISRVFIEIFSLLNSGYVNLLVDINIIIEVMVCLVISVIFLKVFKDKSDSKRKVIFFFLVAIIGVSGFTLLQVFLFGDIIIAKNLLGFLPHALNMVYVVFIMNYLFVKNGMKRTIPFHAFQIGLVMASISFILNSYSFDRIMFTQNASQYPAYVPSTFIMLIVGLGLVVTSIFFIPYVEDLFYLDELVAFYIIDKKNSEILFKQLFQGSEHLVEHEKSILEGDMERLLLGGLTGINELMREFENAKSIEYIDKEKVKFIISQEKGIMMFFVARNYIPVMKSKLDLVMQKFLSYYFELLDFNLLDRSRFTGTKEILNQIMALEVNE